MIEWVGLSAGGKVVEVKPREKIFVTEFGEHARMSATSSRRSALAPSRSRPASPTRPAGVRSIPVTFEAHAQKGVHVIGDSAIAGGMPKSAFAANAQAKACAQAVALMLRGAQAPEPKLINTCYSLVKPDYGISVAGVVRARQGPARRRAERGRRQPRQCAARRSAPRRRTTPRVGTGRSRAKSSGEACARSASRSCFCSRPASAAAEELAPYVIEGGEIRASLTGRPAIRRAGASSWPSGRKGFACSATRRPFPRSGSRAIWRRRSRASARE